MMKSVIIDTEHRNERDAVLIQLWYHSFHEYLVFKNNLHRLCQRQTKGNNYGHAAVKKRTLGLFGRM